LKSVPCELDFQEKRNPSLKTIQREVSVLPEAAGSKCILAKMRSLEMFKRREEEMLTYLDDRNSE